MTSFMFGPVHIEEFAGAVVVAVQGPVGSGHLIEAEVYIQRRYDPDFRMPSDCSFFALESERATGVAIDGRPVLALCEHAAWRGKCAFPYCKHFAG